jgi:Domain of unknown function (DUF4602)
MSCSDDDELAAAEELIACRLATWDVDTELNAAIAATQRPSDDTASAGNDATSVPRQSNRKRRKPKLKSPFEGPSAEQFVQEARARSAEASESVLSRLLVRSRVQPSKTAVGRRIGPQEMVTHKVISPSPEGSEFRVAGSNNLAPARALTVDAALLSARGFVEHHKREVSELGASGLSKKARRDFELRQRQALGCRAPKGQRMPLPMVLGIRKKQREREAKEQQQALESGMLIRSKRGKRGKM